MFKRELVYTIILFVIMEILTTISSLTLYIGFVWLGLIVLITWIILSFIYYSGKKVSKHSEVIMKLQIKNRWYQYIFIPIFLYLTYTAFIYFVRHPVLKQSLILIGTVLIFILLVHIRTTYQRIHTVSSNSKIVFDMINVIIFYIISEIISKLGYLNSNLIIPIFIIFPSLILISNLQIRKRISKKGLLIALLSGISIGIASFFFKDFKPHIFSFLITLCFYLILSFWYIRLSGERELDKYIPPILFTLMSMILVLT